MRASAEPVDRKRFIVSSAESGGSGGGREGGRGGGEERVTHAGELQQLTLQRVAAAAPQQSQPPPVGCLHSRLSGAAGARVCSKMAVVFYLTGNFLLIGLLPEFDSVPF